MKPLLSIVLPTYNEATNIRPLIKSIRNSIKRSFSYEIIFVDDSIDETPNIILKETHKSPRIHLIHRKPHQRTGLATAFVDGFKQARGDYICCMDSDLQHPPPVIPLLVQEITNQDAEIVVASRYIPGGSAEGLNGRYRKFVSIASKYLSQIILPSTRRTSDPCGGFFVFRKKILNGITLSPNGFKILVEILVKTNAQKIFDVPYKFLSREKDESKATIKQGFEFLKHIYRLVITVPEEGRFIKFAIVGATGVLVNLGILYYLVEFDIFNERFAWVSATAISILNNFLLNNLFTYRDKSTSSYLETAKRLIAYYLVSLGSIIVNFAIYYIGLSLNLNYLLSSGLGIVSATFLNFTFSSAIVWPVKKIKNGSFFLKESIAKMFSVKIIGAFMVIIFIFGVVLFASWINLNKNTILAYLVPSLSLFLVLQGMFALFLMLYAWENPERAINDKSPEEYLPPKLSFTAIVPARHEEQVIGDTLKTISSINYPKYLMEIIVVCSEDDVGTIIATNKAINRLSKKNIKLVIYNKQPINKPHALNQAFKHAKKDIVVIFDAEDEPHEDIYNIVNTVIIKDKADVVQSGVQLMNWRSNWFSVFNVMEYYFWFKSSLHFFARQGAIPLSGNTVFFKRKLIKSIGKWDHHCLTEDADIGIRMSKIGAKIRVVYDARHTTHEETPPTITSFVKQRTRWNQGFLQILFKADWTRLPDIRKRLLALYIFVWPILHALLFLYVPFSIWMTISLKLPVLYAMIANAPLYIVILHFITFNVGLYEFTRDYGLKYPIWTPIKTFIFYYPYQLILGFSAFRSITRLVRGNLTWEKTSHIGAHRNMTTASDFNINKSVSKKSIA